MSARASVEWIREDTAKSLQFRSMGAMILKGRRGRMQVPEPSGELTEMLALSTGRIHSLEGMSLGLE